MNFHFSKLFSYENAYDCHPMNKPFVSAVLFGFHGINLLKNLVSRELLRILENFHFSISISKHFDFTFHFSKKSESNFFHFSKNSESDFFHFALLEFPRPTLAGACLMVHKFSQLRFAFSPSAARKNLRVQLGRECVCTRLCPRLAWITFDAFAIVDVGKTELELEMFFPE